jgi:hypothetical protein
MVHLFNNDSTNVQLGHLAEMKAHDKQRDRQWE